MINKLIISSESTNLYTTKEFIKSGKKLKLETIWINPYEQCLNISPKMKPKNKQDSLYLVRTTGIRYDDFDLNVATYFKENEAKISNPLSALVTFRNKDNQQFFFSRHKINFIPSVSLRGALNKEKIQTIKSLCEDENYILKMSRGNGGIGVQIIHGNDSLFSILETFHAIKDQRFLIQPYQLHQKEFRFLFSKTKILAIIEKMKSPDEFRANAKRATGKLRKNIDYEIMNYAQNIFNKSGLDYAGIDIILTKNGPLVLEVNCVPGFMQAQELSEINISKEIILDLLK